MFVASITTVYKSIYLANNFTTSS